MRSWTKACAAVAIVLVSSRARAESVAGGPPVAASETERRAGFEAAATRFHLAGTSGAVATVAPLLDWGVTDTLILRFEAPFHALFLADEATRLGPGDALLRAKQYLVSSEELRVTVGLTLALPTGSARRGLGQGSATLTPFASAGVELGPTIVYASLEDAIDLAPSAHAGDVEWVDPSTEHELRAGAGVFGRPERWLLVGGALRDTEPLKANDRSARVLDGIVQVGLLASGGTRLVLGVEAPLAGAARFDVRGTALGVVSF